MTHSLAEWSRLIARREVSPVDLAAHCLERIAAFDGSLHAFMTVQPETVLAEAWEAEAEIATGGPRGPLHGIPIGIKDLIDVAGLPTIAQAEHRRDHVATVDAGVVAALRRAGAVILGKQATSEYAVGGTRTDGPWPSPRNPWDLSRDACSSSSGSAVAVAAGLCPGSVGTETAGSIRAPAAWCGVAGLKPTDGLVSASGVLPLSRTMDCLGPLAWTVEDCALMLTAMADLPAIDLGGGIGGIRIGVVRDFYEGHPDLDPETGAAMENAISLLQGRGGQLSTIRLDAFATYSDTAKAITWPEEYAEHGAELRTFPDRFGKVARARLEDGKKQLAHIYIAALRRREVLKADLAERMAKVDLLILPTMLKPAQPRGYEFLPGVTDLSLNRPFNLTGNPALSLNGGFLASGLPIGLQLVGRHGEDALVLRAGHVLQAALGLTNRRPPIAE
ncbi:amidase [Pseudoruegeria sp. HB172150]|uniref:amidase n=1 Tax=Pseudoruegeria sp. HB172150 TaxID=2721164 RepID=UPI001552C813|nr:amidase [Pseudoruegeria sp. HB172150]